MDSNLIKSIKTVAHASLLLVILVGNSLLIVVTCRNHQLQTTVHFLILNMAVSDIFLSLFGLPIQIIHTYLNQGRWLVDGDFGTITCKTVAFATDISRIVSVLTLQVIAFERFFSVVYPMQKSFDTLCRKWFLVITLIWLTAAVYPSINFFKFDITTKSSETYCLGSWKPLISNEEAFKIEAPILLVCFTVVPFLLLTSLYSVIVLSLYRQKRCLQLASEARQRRASENKRVTYMLVTVVIVFLATWVPFNIYWFYRAYVWNWQRPCESRHLIFSANFMIYAYPAVNPVIYFIFNENYRNGFKDLLCPSNFFKRLRRRSTKTHAMVSSQLPI